MTGAYDSTRREMKRTSRWRSKWNSGENWRAAREPGGARRAVRVRDQRAFDKTDEPKRRSSNNTRSPQQNRLRQPLRTAVEDRREKDGESVIAVRRVQRGSGRDVAEDLQGVRMNDGSRSPLDAGTVQVLRRQEREHRQHKGKIDWHAETDAAVQSHDSRPEHTRRSASGQSVAVDGRKMYVVGAPAPHSRLIESTHTYAVCDGTEKPRTLPIPVGRRSAQALDRRHQHGVRRGLSGLAADRDALGGRVDTNEAPRRRGTESRCFVKSKGPSARSVVAS
jgi:hypothetical protein